MPSMTTLSGKCLPFTSCAVKVLPQSGFLHRYSWTTWCTFLRVPRLTKFLDSQYGQLSAARCRCCSMLKALPSCPSGDSGSTRGSTSALGRSAPERTIFLIFPQRLIGSLTFHVCSYILRINQENCTFRC